MSLPLIPVLMILTAAHAGVVAPGATLQKLAGDFLFTEGPTADAAGNVYFTDQPNDRILVWRTDGKLETFLQPAGRSNGLCIDSKGNLWACADGKFELWRISATDRKIDVVLRGYDGAGFNGPNDVWVRSDGGAYFTDPYYQRDYWQRTAPALDREAVYFLAPDRKTLSQVAGDLVKPNGIVGTADGRTLFVADIGAGKTWRYAIQPDGTLADKTLFCEMGSDGITLDIDGNLYLTGKGVTVFDRDGKKIAHIDVPEPWTANVCFGGPDRKTLFITASTGLYAIAMAVAGQ